MPLSSVTRHCVYLDPKFRQEQFRILFLDRHVFETETCVDAICCFAPHLSMAAIQAQINFIWRLPRCAKRETSGAMMHRQA